MVLAPPPSENQPMPAPESTRSTSTSAAGSRGVDLGEDERVRVVEGSGEIAQQVARARVAVRLEGADDAPMRKRRARAGQRGADLRRMVAVIVHHGDAAHLPAHGEAALHSL